MSGLHRRFILMLVGMIAPLIVLVGRVEFGASTSCELAQQSETNGDLEEAAYQYQRCAKWNTFVTGKSDWALAQLNRMSETAEGEGKLELALLAARYIRGSQLSTDHLWRVRGEEEKTINQRIAGLTARLQYRSGALTVRGRTLPKLEADHLSLLERRNGPSPLEGTLIFILFLSWVGACAWAIWRGLSPDGRINRGPMLRALCMMTMLFGLFCLALSTANA
ncbi:MAG: hypothetical protein ACPGQS_01190 [Bradymonadia bacterium]